MIGKIKVSKKVSPEQSKGMEAITSPSFALFEVSGAKQVINTAISGKRKKLLTNDPKLTERGTTP
jgi:hypothetical protein